MDFRLDNLTGLIDHVVVDYFVRGEMPHECAFAKIVLANEYAKSLLDEPTRDDLLDAYESKSDCVPVMFSDDEAIQQLIDLLVEQRDMLRNSSTPRNSMSFVKAIFPNLRLLPPLKTEE